MLRCSTSASPPRRSSLQTWFLSQVTSLLCDHGLTILADGVSTAASTTQCPRLADLCHVMRQRMSLRRAQS